MSLWSRRKVYVDNLPQTHDLRFAALFACGLIALLGGLYAVGYYVAGDRVPGGTTVAGVDLGNLTTAEAEAELADKVKPRLDRPIRLKGSDRELTLEPRQSGLTFDIDATVDRALDGESWDPRHMLRVLLGGDDLSPVIAVNQTALDQQLRRLASRLFDKPVESSVSFASGRPRVTAGNAGVELDIPLTRERVIAAFTRGSAVARLPLRAVAPQISPTEAADFVADVAAPAVSAPVDIAVGRDDVRLRPGQFSRSLQAEVSKDGGLRLAIDAESLFLRSRAQINALPSRPVDAKIRLVSGRPVVVPSRTGLAVTEQALADSVLRALRRSDSRRAVAETQVVEARFTTREVRDLQIRQRLSSSVVSYEAAERDAVLKQANNLDGTLLGAGRRFDFAKSAGLPDSDGASSVVASATFAAAFHAGMTAFERTENHSFDDRFTQGLDAYVSASRDLAFRNSTPFGVYVRATTTAYSTGGSVNVELWGSRYFDIEVASNGRYNVVPAGLEILGGPGCRPSFGADGFETDVRRVMSRRGETPQIDTVHSSYAAVPMISCQG